MNTRAYRTAENRQQFVASHSANQYANGKTNAQLVSNGMDTLSQQRFQPTINNKANEQWRTFQLMSNNSYNVKQLKSFQNLANNFSASTLQRKGNNNGLPEKLKDGVENLSGISMDDVKVHYNSDKPAQVNARAYAQGSDIHLGPGQEQHLAHEAWHVVQQKEGRVKPTLQMKGRVNINDDAGLEKEADTMGAKAMHGGETIHLSAMPATQRKVNVVQRVVDFFVPDALEPHIHVHDGGMTFTDVGHAHKYLVRGDKVLEANVSELRKDLVARGDPRSLKLNRWIKNHILR